MVETLSADEDEVVLAGGDEVFRLPPGDGPVLLHGALGLAALLGDGSRLTGVTGWRLRLGEAPDSLDPALSARLG